MILKNSKFCKLCRVGKIKCSHLFKLFTPSKFPNWTFYGLGLNSFSTQGKSRHYGLDQQSQELTYATPYQVRGDILEI